MGLVSVPGKCRDEKLAMIREIQIVWFVRLAAELLVADGTATAGRGIVEVTAECGICEASGQKDLLAPDKVNC